MALMSNADDAHMMEMLSPGWAVVWGEWRRTFTAWAMWTHTSVCVEARSLDELTAAIQQAEAEYSRVPTTSYGMFRQAP
jgi:hypothetical protein